MPFDFDALKNVLFCPKSRTKLVLDGRSLVCVDPDCRLRYEIRDEIPIMLVDEAAELPADEWREIMHRHGQPEETGA